MKLLYSLITILTLSNSFLFAQKTNKNIQVELQGNSPQETETINELVLPTPYPNKQTLLDELSKLETKFRSLGYFDFAQEIEQKNDSTYISKINLGSNYPSIKLQIPNNKTLKEYIRETNFQIIQDSIVLKTAFAKAYLEELSSIASNNGNPFARFQILNISKNENTLKGTLSFESDKKRTIDKIKIEGYKDIPESFLRYNIGLKTGAPFNRKKLNNQSKTLSLLPFVNQTKTPQVLFKTDSTTIYLYLERKNVNKFDGFLGFTTDDNNDLQLNGNLNLLLVNNFNYGERFTLNYKADGQDQSQLSIETELPYLFKTPIGIDASLKIFRKDSTFSTTEQSIALRYQINQNNGFSIGYRSSQSEDLTEISPLIENQQNLEDFTSTKITTSYTYKENSNNTFFPTKRLASIQANIGNRLTNNQTNSQISIESIFEENIPINKHTTISLKNTTSYLNSDTYITNELYRFGGIKSIRGFDENSIFANFINTINTEFRHQLNTNIYINSILDYSYFENDIENNKENLFSIGIGTSLITRAGVLKLNLANGKFENQPFVFSNTKLHIILEVSF